MSPHSDPILELPFHPSLELHLVCPGTADKKGKLTECRGLAIMLPEYTQLKDISEFLASTCKFAVFSHLADPTQPRPLWELAMKPSFPRSQMESEHLVEFNHRPIVVVVKGIHIHDFRFRGNDIINIKDDIIMPLFSSYLADNPKIFLFLSDTSHRPP